MMKSLKFLEMLRHSNKTSVGIVLPLCVPPAHFQVIRKHNK